MRKRKMDIDQLRKLVRMRFTKGAAFMLSHEEYQAEQRAVKAELEGMTREQILSQYSSYTYDVE